MQEKYEGLGVNWQGMCVLVQLRNKESCFKIGSVERQVNFEEFQLICLFLKFLIEVFSSRNNGTDETKII